MSNPLKHLTKHEWFLWLASLAVVTISNLASGRFDLLTFIATWVGVTALIFLAKGHVIAQILIIIFSVLYAVISWRFRYWGELITYAGMTLPMAIWSTVTWLRHPAENGREVAIQRLTGKHIACLTAATAAVTALFFFLLRWLDTPNLIISTISITTSFVAASLSMLRSSYYAFWYALNDLVLMALWTLASIENPVYIPVVANFSIFLLNDAYGFLSWKKRERVQRQSGAGR